jgi:hypothetical protein
MADPYDWGRPKFQSDGYPLDGQVNNELFYGLTPMMNNELFYGLTTMTLERRMHMVTRWLKPKAPTSPGWSRIYQILITIGWWFIGGHSALAQPTINFNNYDPARGIDAPIYDVSICGTKLEGTAFFAQLFGGVPGTPEEALWPISNPVNFRTGAAAGYVDVRTGSIVALPGVASGATAVLQVRAWSANGGTTWEAARNSYLWDFSVRAGQSQVIYVNTASSPGDSNILGLYGLQSFPIRSFAEGGPPYSVCPEPPAIALSLFGTAVCLLCRRKRVFG